MVQFQGFKGYIPRALQPVDPGRYRDQCRIQEKVVSGQDSYGADTITWRDKYVGYFAVRQLSGSESARVAERWAEAQFEVEGQWLSGVDETMRISWWDGLTDRILNILSATDPNGRRERIWLICKEVKGAAQ